MQPTRRATFRSSLTCLLLMGIAGPTIGATIWIEGEKPTRQSMTPQPQWYGQVKKGELSAGDWLSTFSDTKAANAAYTFDVAETEDYVLWLRANPTRTKMTWKLAGKPPEDVPTSTAVDVRNIAADGGLDLRFIGWIRVGRVTLPKGKQTLEIAFQRAEPGINIHGGIDAIVLTTEKWVPDGLAKPGAPGASDSASDEPDSWPFVYENDFFKPDAALDLRSLNETVAGETGFIRLSEDGNSFVRGDGQPIRFWAANGNWGLPKGAVETHARFLAKIGVNMVRVHADLAPKNPGQKITEVDREELDKLWRWVAAGKKEGIYTTISPWWAHHEAQASWGIEGYDKVQPWGLIFFNPVMQQGYKAWVKALYTEKNPYTGIPLAEDPAVAIAQVQNEDSMLFWTTQAMKPEQQRLLGKQFGDWLTKKYGSLDKAKAAWEGTASDQDRFADGVVGILLIYDMTQDQTGGRAVRVNDQTEFFTELQRNFYADMVKYYHDELGVKSLTNASNWISADNVRLGDQERYTYTPGDVIAVNRYYGGEHVGEANGWRIDPGHTFTDPSAVLDVRNFPGNLKQVVGHPMAVTESSWVHPMSHQAEGPFLMSVYQSLTGLDMYYWFAFTDTEYHSNPFLTFLNFNGQHPTQKWTCSTPDLAGQFPANALMFRKGYIQQADPVVQEVRSLQGMWDRKIPVIAEGGSFDPNRWDGKTGAMETVVPGGVNPLAFLVGPVTVQYGGDPTASKTVDLSKYIDEKAKVITSATGQVRMDYATGLCTVNAPKAQGATGFFAKAGEIALDDVTIKSDNDYGALVVVPLDDQPIASSGKLLVQFGGKAQPTGWKVEPAKVASGDKQVDGFRVVNTGKPPYQVANAKLTLTVRNPNLTKATLLDTNGMRTKTVESTSADGVMTLTLPPDTMYLIIE